jgi:hypothetical protein
MSRKNIYLILGALLILVLGFLIKQSATFHLVRTVPANGSQPNQYTEISFNFSRPLAPSKGTANQITITPSVAGRSSIKGSQITFIPIAAYNTNTKYTATLSGISGSKGEKLPDISITFSPLFVDYSDLPKEVRDRLVTQTDVNDSAKAPYSAAIIAISNSNQLLNYGMTSDQLANLQKAFYKYFGTIHQHIRSVELTNLKKTPHDPQSASRTNTISFSVSWSGSNTYSAKVDYTGLTASRLYIYGSGGSVVFDSGDISD